MVVAGLKAGDNVIPDGLVRDIMAAVPLDVDGIHSGADICTELDRIMLPAFARKEVEDFKILTLRLERTERN